MQATTPRARSIEEAGALMGRLFGPDEIGRAIQSFRPRPSDVIIAPFGKSGTTWLQQMFHCLRTDGDMDFDDISRVVPWIETSVALGIDINADQRAEPRGFKSHLSYDAVPKGARYIVVLRDPKDAFVSMYNFMSGWFLEPGAVALSDYLPVWMTGPGGDADYWTHLLSWYGQRDSPDLLLLTYEAMNARPEQTIRRVAAFCGLPMDEARLTRTLEMTSLPYMLAHKDRFDDAMMRKLSEDRCGLPPGSDSAKVRSKESRQAIDPADAARLDAIWAERVTPVLGFRNYAELRETIG